MNLIDKVKQRLLMYTFKVNFKPYKETTIIFDSFGGRQVSDSPLAIYKEMKQAHPEYQLVWAINKDAQSEVPAGVNYVVNRTFKWAVMMKKAQVWVENARQPRWVIKSSHTKIVQTWHGTPLKKLGLDIKEVTMPGTTTEKYHENFQYEANRWDVLLSPNQYSTDIFRKAFGYHNEILEVGYPRNDKLANVSDAEVQKLKQHLNIPMDKKVVLYAPTYRDNQFFTKGKYSFKLPFDLEKFKQRFGDNTVLLLRMHYLIANQLDLNGFEDVAIDVSSYPDVSDLYLVSDLLVTDYSSVFFDYAYLKRPIIFFPYDYEIYKDELRGFYLDYENDLPGEIVRSESELYDQIFNQLMNNQNIVNKKIEEFHEKFCKIDAGSASQKVVNWIGRYLN